MILHASFQLTRRSDGAIGKRYSTLDGWVDGWLDGWLADEGVWQSNTTLRRERVLSVGLRRRVGR
jgi:hypothetical protein